MVDLVCQETVDYDLPLAVMRGDAASPVGPIALGIEPGTSCILSYGNAPISWVSLCSNQYVSNPCRRGALSHLSRCRHCH
jgi:hypothetical protein